MEWRVINDFDQYRIYQDGRVWSCRRKIVLKPCGNGCGYKVVILSKDGATYPKTVHRLVAQHFIDNPENKEMVDHIDRDKTNNMYWNLRWTTRSENGINSTRKKNKSGEKFIRVIDNRFVVQITRHKIYKTFKTLDEAVEYRNAVCGMYDLVY